MNRFATSSLLAAALMLCGTAHAQLSANLGLTSKYKYRGQDQSDPAKSTLPAVQGGFDYAFGDFYVGNWNSSVSGATGGTEVDLYGGYKFNVSGIAMDAGVLTYLYPGSGNSNLNTTEAYLGGTQEGTTSAAAVGRASRRSQLRTGFSRSASSWLKPSSWWTSGGRARLRAKRRCASTASIAPQL